MLAFWATSSPSHLPYGANARDVGEFGLQVVGSPESVGEVVLLKTLTTIISEWGGTVARVRVNAMGDKDSKMRFARELSVYLRKHAPEMDVACRQMLQDPLAAFACQSAISRDVMEGGPRAMNFLSEKSRAHFREVLEHLEGLGLPYELDDMLVGDEREPRVVFAVDLEGEDNTITAAIGGRFDDYLRRITGRKEGSSVSASIFFRKQGLLQKSFTLPKPGAVPKIFFVQLGLRAKLQGLTVLDQLRRARVSVLQSFNAAQLAPQLQAARAAGVTHLIIMGQREALDGTVLVRSMTNSSQEVVTLAALPRYVKTLR
jgi:histidyl-tRNA synthetase